ncbi:MAG: ubiquinone/menaquinone biosynthesis methyltransferase [Spirochaetota bacterium]|nr:ubiquinone/menaquinone biosynthesis methyltransferase [Spirochaetota bacterium]
MKSRLGYEINNDNPEDKKRFIRGLFKSIVSTYDIANRVLSFGIDMRWRREMLSYINILHNIRAVDLCCGTGDVTKLFHKRGIEVFPIDFSIDMIRKGVKRRALRDRSIVADVSSLPLKDNSFNLATIAFGVRNIPDLDIFMIEVRRILTKGGKLILLELVRPENIVIRFLYSLYLNIMLPFVGGLMSFKPMAYRYLSRSIATFMSPENLKFMLEKHGFVEICHYFQTFGIAIIIVCQKDQS